MRRVQIFLWCLVIVFFLAKCAILDVMSAFSLVILLLVGYYVPFGSEPMKQLAVMRYGGVAILFGGADLVVCVLHIHTFVNGWDSYVPLVGYVKAGWPHEVSSLEAQKQSHVQRYLTTMSFFAVIVSVLLPILEFTIAYHCYTIYKEKRRMLASSQNEQTRLRGGQGQGDRTYGAPGRPTGPPRQGNARGLRPFEGRHYRLAEDDRN